MQMAKGLAAMYKDMGISPEIAIKKVHRLWNPPATKNSSPAAFSVSQITQSTSCISHYTMTSSIRGNKISLTPNTLVLGDDNSSLNQLDYSQTKVDGCTHFL